MSQNRSGLRGPFPLSMRGGAITGHTYEIGILLLIYLKISMPLDYIIVYTSYLANVMFPKHALYCVLYLCVCRNASDAIAEWIHLSE